MFERLQKPFLTVETGEAYGPVRLEYDISQKDSLLSLINSLHCCEKNNTGNAWSWYWRDECDDLHFESLETYKKNPSRAVRLGTLTLRDDKLFIALPSFKRACLAVPFFYKHLPESIAKIAKADFINKVFSLDERLPHGFTELFKDEELDQIVHNRIAHYDKMQATIEQAATAEEALKVLTDYAQAEANKRLPYAERYDFLHNQSDDPEVVSLGFYIFLRSRELVAIRRWHGETGASLAEIADETIKDIFGDVNFLS